LLQQNDYVPQWNNIGSVQGYDYQPCIGGRPGRGRAGFGQPVSGFNRNDGHARGRGNFADNHGNARGRPNYSGRYSYDRRLEFYCLIRTVIQNHRKISQSNVYTEITYEKPD
uniref:Reverse transcriptase domain-containing protein n=1 Tax=Onchocerca flexuosa TaxID=387005 RepID=A0A183HSW6_9BILA